MNGADELWRLIFELVGIVGVDRQDGMPRLGVPEERVGQPRRTFAEGVARRVFEAHQLQRFVAPQRLDIARTGSIGALRDCSDKGCGIEGRAAVRDR